MPSSPEPGFLGRLLSCRLADEPKMQTLTRIKLITVKPASGQQVMTSASFFVTRKGYDCHMEQPPAADVTVAILAGGKSTRMGRDKAFVEFEGRTLLARSLDLARAISLHVRIIGSGDKFAPFAPVVEDEFPNCGPLGGIHAALRASHTDLTLILAVDMPFIPRLLLQHLIAQALGAPNAMAVVPRGDAGWQPLCAVYRRKFAVAAEQALRAGRNKIDLLFDRASTRVIEPDELQRAGFSSDVFRNLNTPEELHAQKGSA
jgi:molybdopterin-guanine dinucleotide biosynthesis protein A